MSAKRLVVTMLLCLMLSIPNPASADILAVAEFTSPTDTGESTEPGEVGLINTTGGFTKKGRAGCIVATLSVEVKGATAGIGVQFTVNLDGTPMNPGPVQHTNLQTTVQLVSYTFWECDVVGFHVIGTTFMNTSGGGAANKVTAEQRTLVVQD